MHTINANNSLFLEMVHFPTASDTVMPILDLKIDTSSLFDGLHVPDMGSTSTKCQPTAWTMTVAGVVSVRSYRDGHPKKLRRWDIWGYAARPPTTHCVG